MPDSEQSKEIFILKGYENEVEMFVPRENQKEIHPLKLLIRIAAEKARGVLTCKADTGESYLIGLENGNCYGALVEGQTQEEALVRKLVDYVGMDINTVKYALMESKQSGKGTVGFIMSLMGMGSISPQQIMEVIRASREDVLKKVVAIRSGKAWVESESRLPIPNDPIKIDLLKYANEYLQNILKRHYHRELVPYLNVYMGLYPTISPALTPFYREILISQQEKKSLNDMDGSVALRDFFAMTNLSKHDAARLITRLLFLDFLRFDKLPTTDASVQKTESELSRMAAKLSGMNHFVRLGIHWTAHTSEIDAAFQKRIRLWGPHSKLRDVSPKSAELCDRLFALAQESYAVLSDTEKRQEYRKEVVEQKKLMDGADFLYQQAQISLFRGDMETARKQIESALDIVRKPLYLKFYQRLGGRGKG